MLLSAVGVAIGFIAALALMRVMSNMLVGVTATDPATFAAIAGLFFLIAVMASWAAAADKAARKRFSRLGPANMQQSISALKKGCFVGVLPAPWGPQMEILVNRCLTWDPTRPEMGDS